MPRKLSNALTPLSVKNAKPGRHADGGGLHLLVKESGARSWVYRFMLSGKTRDVGLGAASGPEAITLATARDKAAGLRLQVKAGVDPLAERQREAAEALAATQAAQIAGITFKAVAEAYIAANEGSWRNDKHRAQWRSTLASYVYPVMGDLPVGDIGTAHVLKILEPIWQAKPETASRVRGRIETVLDAAKARGYREGENPARWRGHIAQILPARSRLTRGHHKALPYEAVPAFVGALRAREAMAALALEFVILTASRTGEVLGATWGEADLAKAIWTIPAARMKAGKEHRVPLSPRAVEILETVQPLGSEVLFPSDKGGKLSGMAMSMLLRRMGVDATVHGFRSAFRDWSAECTGYAHEVCEMALAHVIGNKAEAAYRRGDLFDKRRRLMADWAAYCASTGTTRAEVMPIRGRDVAQRALRHDTGLGRDKRVSGQPRHSGSLPYLIIGAAAECGMDHHGATVSTSSPAERRRLGEHPFVSLPEALTWIAFGEALVPDDLRAQVEGHRPPVTYNPEELLRKIYAEVDRSQPEVPGTGHFHIRELGLERLRRAWHSLRDEVERGTIKMRARFTSTYAFSDARLAGVDELTGGLLASFSQFDVSTGGIRRQPHGSPAILWQDHPHSFDREVEAFGDDARAAGGYLMVEVESVALLRQFPRSESSHGDIKVAVVRKRPGPAPDPDWPAAIAKVTLDCIAAGYKRTRKRGDKAAIQTMLLSYMGDRNKHFSDDIAAKHAETVIAALPDN